MWWLLGDNSNFRRTLKYFLGEGKWQPRESGGGKSDNTSTLTKDAWKVDVKDSFAHFARH